MKTRSTTFCVLASALALAVACTATAAGAATLGGIGVRPATFDPSRPATRAYFILRVAPARSRRAVAVVTNTGGRAVRLNVDPVDGLTGVTAGVVYADRSAALGAAGAWVTAATRTLTIPPHGQAIEPFTVHVPAGAVPGDHVAGLAFQPAHTRHVTGDFAVTVVVRTVVGIQIIVPGRAAQQARIFGVRLAPLPGTSDPSAVVSLEDTGRLLCHPSLSVSIGGAGTTHAVTRTLSTILPGDRIAFPFAWPGRLAQGSYRVRASIRHCGTATTRSTLAQYTLNTPTKTSSTVGPHIGPTAPIAQPSPPATGSWWAYALVAAAALIAGVGLSLGIRRRGVH